MYEKILITGTPGTGKTMAAQALSGHLKTGVLHVTDYIKQREELILDKEKDGTVIPDMVALQRELNEKRGIIESHLLCEFKLRSSIVIVLRCHPFTLERRLKSRKYSAQKMKDNLESEALDYCTQNAMKHYKKVFEIDTTERSADETAQACLDIIRGRSEGDSVDFSDWLMKRK
ncbi:MAG: adenylate kinase family protein [Candidatus Micrarchaeota archaeon]